MILDKGVDVNLQDGIKETPLMIASRQGSVAAVRELLKRGADKSLTNVHGQTALDFARTRNDQEIIALLSG
jgi:ankyrin repeat protein